MPAKHTWDYKRPYFLFNQHLETIYPAIFRKVAGIPPPSQEKLNTPDKDFLEVDFYPNNHQKLLILQHGLEGDSTRPYMLGMIHAFLGEGYDVCAWNYRGCGKEINNQPIFYHSGASYDLEVVVDHFKDQYADITLIGFSLGANMTLKYLGEQTRPPQIKRAIAFSVPLDLSTGSDTLSSPNCYIYKRRFLKLLGNKIKRKAKLMPDQLDASLLNKVKSIRDFDDMYTGPMHGYKDAEEYYQQCSSKNFLEGITIPTLIVNALNDPFLSKESLDHKLTSHLKNVSFETTITGGHVGFTSINKKGIYWSEQKALNFCRNH